MGKNGILKKYNKNLVLCISALLMLAVITWILSYLGFLKGSNFENSFLYFFSATAQTMGAIVALAMTAIYALATAINTSQELTKEPVKRILFRDGSLSISVYCGLATIISALFGVLIVSTSGSSLYIMIPLTLIVLGLGIISLARLIIFLFVRGPIFLNPVLLIRNDVFNNKKTERSNIIFIENEDNKIDYTIISLFLNNLPVDINLSSLFILFDPIKSGVDKNIESLFTNFIDRFKSDFSIIPTSHVDQMDNFIKKLFESIFGSTELIYIKPDTYQNDQHYFECVNTYSNSINRLCKESIQLINVKHLNIVYDVFNHWVLNKSFKDTFSFMQDPDREPGFGTVHQYTTNLKDGTCAQHFNRWFDLMNLLNFKLRYNYSFFRTNNLQFKAFKNLMILEPVIDTNEQFLKLLQNVTASFVMDLHKIFTYMINIAADDKENAETQKYIKRIEYLIDPFKNFIEKYYKNEEEKKYITSGFYIEDLDPYVMNVIRYMLFCKNVIVGIYYSKLLTQRMMYIRNTNWSIIDGVSSESEKIYNLMYDESSGGKDQIDSQELRDSFEIGFALAKSIMLVKKVKSVIGDIDGTDQKEIANKYFEYIKSTREVKVHLDYFLAGVEYGIKFEEFLERNDVS